MADGKHFAAPVSVHYGSRALGRNELVIARRSSFVWARRDTASSSSRDKWILLASCLSRKCTPHQTLEDGSL